MNRVFSFERKAVLAVVEAFSIRRSNVLCGRLRELNPRF